MLFLSASGASRRPAAPAALVATGAFIVAAVFRLGAQTAPATAAPVEARPDFSGTWALDRSISNDASKANFELAQRTAARPGGFGVIADVAGSVGRVRHGDTAASAPDGGPSAGAHGLAEKCLGDARDFASRSELRDQRRAEPDAVLQDRRR